MKVKCVNIGGAHLLVPDLALGNTRSSIFHVTVGRDYTVYGVLFYKMVASYLIKNDSDRPSWIPASLFEITCSRVSRSWSFANWSSPDEYICVATFFEIVQTKEAFDQLALGEKSAYATFFNLSGIADLEFPDPSIKETAELIQDQWLICPFCSEALESKTLDALIRCPVCGRVFNNPSYAKLGARE